MSAARSSRAHAPTSPAALPTRRVPSPGPDATWGPRTAQLGARVAQLQTSQAAQAQRQRLEKLVAPRAVGEASVQLKLQVAANPHLKSASLATPTQGQQEVATAAKAIDVGTEKGILAVNQALDGYSKGQLTSDQIKATLPDTGHRTNFINKLIDWGNGKPMGSQLAATAGYVIEDFASQAAPSNTLSQVSSGGARPDFEVDTGQQWSPRSGARFLANGFVDVTSQAEAAKGHVAEKLLRMSEPLALAHPHLYDSYYAAVVVPGAVTRAPAEMTGKAYLSRMNVLALRVKMAERRRQTLRSANPLDAKKRVGKPNPKPRRMPLGKPRVVLKKWQKL